VGETATDMGEIGKSSKHVTGSSLHPHNIGPLGCRQTGGFLRQGGIQ